MDGLVAVVVGLHFYDRGEDRVWGDRVVVIEMVIAGCLFANVSVSYYANSSDRYKVG
jgi:hypothetical protein